MLRRSVAPLMGVALLLVLSSAANVQAFELFNSFMGDGGCGCAAAPSCGCAAPSCCAPKCCKSRCHKSRCCASSCCSVEPSCCG